MTTPSFDPVAYLLGQLNLINPDELLPLSTGNATITNPLPTDESVATDSVAPVINTSATLTPIAGQGFGSTSQFYYQRVNPLADLTARGHTGSLSISGAGVTDWPSFFTAFNAAYGTVFTAVDYPTAPFSLPSSGPLAVTMPPGSLLFIGSMNVTIGESQLPLSSVIHTTTLAGLFPPTTLSALITNAVVSTGLTLSQLSNGGQSPSPSPN